MTCLSLMARLSMPRLLSVPPVVIPSAMSPAISPAISPVVSLAAGPVKNILSNFRRGGLLLASLCLLTCAPGAMAAASDAILVESRTVESRTAEFQAEDADPSAAVNLNVAAPENAAATMGSTMSQAVQQLPFEAPVEEGLAGTAEVADGEMEGMETQYHMQLLEQDVLTLRGLVEELQYQLQRLKKTQDDRYLELDGRFQSLRGQLASGTLAAEVGPAVVTPAPVVGEIVAPQVTGQSEKALYDTALELIRNRQYDLAISQLQAVIDRYPSGTYAANAYYWLGEVYAAKPEPNYEKARQALAQVIEFFPDHQKVPDAAFKLGKVYYLMGDCVKARELLKQVVEQHQGKSVAKLAGSYLRDNMASCES
jgi:tol-pal system protein YbgF